MNIIAHIVAMTLSPYWVEIQAAEQTSNANDHRVVVMNEDVYAAKTRSQGVRFYERSTGKQLPFDEGITRASDVFRSRVFLDSRDLPLHFKLSPPKGALSAHINGFVEDVKVGTVNEIDYDALRILLPDNTRLGAKGNLASLPCVWIGDKQSLVILPLTDRPLREENRSNRDPGWWDYLNVRAEVGGTDGKSAVGLITAWNDSGPFHAAHWELETLTARNLNPRWATHSNAYAVDGDLVVGVAWQGEAARAILWEISSKRVIVLRENAHAHDVRGNLQVGDATFKGKYRAAAWRGTSESYIDLHATLPATVKWSRAYWIDKKGTMFGLAEDEKGRVVGVEWKENPIRKLLDRK